MSRAAFLSILAGACALIAAAACGEDAANGGLLKKVFYSQASLDGMISDQDYFTATNAMETVGDDVSDGSMRLVLVFDISDLPDNVGIESALLSVYQADKRAGSSSPPAATNLGYVFVDHITNCANPADYYGIEPVDVNIGILATNFLPDVWHSVDVTIALQDDLLIHKNGYSCYRLYHEIRSDDDEMADCEAWVMGDAANNQPMLTVTYTMP